MKTIEDIKSLQAQAILRLNCPGFGGSGLLSTGKARPLVDYRVIIVNPVSIVHLFEDDPLLLREVDVALREGLTSCKLSDDQITERISEQIELRSPELFQFLAGGGLLIYYLCRPFIVNSGIKTMDNYAWLCGLAPDQPGEATMSEQTVRHMSAVAHGRNIDLTPEAAQSEFNKYLQQVGLEWSTIIRTDFLTSGYTSLAQAGPKKCIAGELIAGDNGGRVIFLPAPYSPDFDRVLIECINTWYANIMGFALVSDTEIPANGNNGQAIEKIEVAHLSIDEAATVEDEAKIQIEQPVEQMSPIPPPVIEPDRPVVQPVVQAPPVVEPNRSVVQPVVQVPPVIKPEKALAPNVVEGIRMPKIIEGITEEANMADWCKSFWLPGVHGILKEIQEIQKQIRDLEKELTLREDTVSSVEEIKPALLAGKPGDLPAGCKVVLHALGWEAEINSEADNEIVLYENGNPVALGRIAVSLSGSERSELARLTESLAKLKSKFGVESKGILIACTFCETPISQRKEPDFPELVIEFAKRKNICLITTTQLISIYLEIKLKKLDTEKLRQDILSLSGALKGFSLV